LGARIGEIGNLRVKDVVKDKYSFIVYNAPQKLDSVLRWNLPTYSIIKGRQIYEKKVSGGLQGESRS